MEFSILVAFLLIFTNITILSETFYMSVSDVMMSVWTLYNFAC